MLCENVMKRYFLSIEYYPIRQQSCKALQPGGSLAGLAKDHMKLSVMTLRREAGNEMEQILPSDLTWGTKKLKEHLSAIDGMKCKRTEELCFFPMEAF